MAVPRPLPLKYNHPPKSYLNLLDITLMTVSCNGLSRVLQKTAKSLYSTHVILRSLSGPFPKELSFLPTEEIIRFS
jgi:hypothetical protein